MSWSLKITNGDFAVTGAGFETVIREAKLVQDLRNFLLTELGTDPLYPWYGSSIDGSTNVESPIASDNWPLARVMIESEIRRVAAKYQQLQLNRAKADRIRYNKSSLSAAEILAAITTIQFVQATDTMTVTVHFTTATDKTLSTDIILPPVISR